VALHLVKLKRINKAEREIILNCLHPESIPLSLGNNDTYYPKLGAESIKILTEIYQRYEITEENRMYKALEQLKEIKTV
jgi:hypothetical protein